MYIYITYEINVVWHYANQPLVLPTVCTCGHCNATSTPICLPRRTQICACAVAFSRTCARYRLLRSSSALQFVDAHLLNRAIARVTVRIFVVAIESAMARSLSVIGRAHAFPCTCIVVAMSRCACNATCRSCCFDASRAQPRQTRHALSAAPRHEAFVLM